MPGTVLDAQRTSVSLILSQLREVGFALPLSQCRKPGLGAVKDFPKSHHSELMNPKPVPLTKC